jgi:hypothetical protein
MREASTCTISPDAGPTIVEAIQVGDFIPQPRKVENTIDAHEHMVIRNEAVVASQ